MKIIMDNCVYVQKYDLANLDYLEENVLSSLSFRKFGEGIVRISDSNKYDFVKFDDPKEIEYFKNLDWIVDYNAVKDLNKIGFVILGEEIIDKMQKLVNNFDEAVELESSYYLGMIDDYEKYRFKLESLKAILLFKQGKLKMVLPSGVEYPKGYINENKKNNILSRMLKKVKKR